MPAPDHPHEESGFVVAASDGATVVEIAPSACCGSCGLCSAIGGKMRLELPTDDLPDELRAALTPGRRVIVGVPRSVPAASLLLVFGLPLLGLVGGALLGYALPIPMLGQDLSAAAFAVALLAVALLVAAVADRRIGRRLPQPKLIRFADGTGADVQEQEQAPSSSGEPTPPESP
jgi:positive regulator of sigma E activity